MSMIYIQKIFLIYYYLVIKYYLQHKIENLYYVNDIYSENIFDILLFGDKILFVTQK